MTQNKRSEHKLSEAVVVMRIQILDPHCPPRTDPDPGVKSCLKAGLGFCSFAHFGRIKLYTIESVSLNFEQNPKKESFLAINGLTVFFKCSAFFSAFSEIQEVSHNADPDPDH